MANTMEEGVNWPVTLSGGATSGRAPELCIRLFGELSVQSDDQRVDRIGAAKAQELFCYLILNRQRPHARETLAALLWGDTPTSQSKKYLRQVLWQLQSALRAHAAASGGAILLVGSDSVRLNPAAQLWLDVAVFEAALARTQSIPCGELDSAMVAALQAAVELYRGPLLEGWYQDWCLQERERLQGLYLRILDKLAGHCEASERLDEALHYAALSLRCDRARERTHQQLMRIYAQAGDRAAALRQYDRCVVALQQELGVQPSPCTAELYQKINAGQLVPAAVLEPQAGLATTAVPSLSDVLRRLERLEAMLADIQREVKRDLRVVNGTRPVAGRHRDLQPPVQIVAAPGDRDRRPKRAADG